LPGAYIALTLDGKFKRIKHSNVMPPGLDELERTIERTTAIHRWLHGDCKDRLTLKSSLDRSPVRNDDLKDEENVKEDVWTRIKPGMTRLMQAAGGGGIEAEVLDAERRMRRPTEEDRTRWSLTKLR